MMIRGSRIRMCFLNQLPRVGFRAIPSLATS
jgi:hypothetical protein